MTFPALPPDSARELASAIAHELRNAMTPLTMRADMLVARSVEALPIETRDLAKLACDVALVNARIEMVIASIRMADEPEEFSGAGREAKTNYPCE